MTTAEEVYADVEKRAGEDNDLVLFRVLELAVEKASSGGCLHCLKKIQYVKTKLRLHHAKKVLNRTENDMVEFESCWINEGWKQQNSDYKRLFMLCNQLRGEANEQRAEYRTAQCVCDGQIWESLARINKIFLTEKKPKALKPKIFSKKDSELLEARIKRDKASQNHLLRCRHCCFKNRAVEIRQKTSSGLFKDRLEIEALEYERLAGIYVCTFDKGPGWSNEKTDRIIHPEKYPAFNGRLTNGC